jgi:hypothetical protein
MPNPTPVTGGETLYYSSPAGQWRRGVIRERVTGVGSSGYLQLQQKLPKNSKYVHAILNNRNAITPRMASSATAGAAGQAGVALVAAAALTSIPGIAQSAANSTSNIISGMFQTAFGASVAANSRVQGIAAAAATAGGILDATLRGVVSTVDLSLFVLPFVSTAPTAQVTSVGFYVNTSATTGTTQNTLNGTGTATSGSTTADFDVLLVFDQFVPDNDA